ncbi:hypothetical protein FHS10_003752 [Mucilaginibacter dorajii]|nr:hypothetical protein [Mucilaginibacter dorajii]
MKPKSFDLFNLNISYEARLAIYNPDLMLL